MDGATPAVPELTKLSKQLRHLRQDLADREGRPWVPWKKIPMLEGHMPYAVLFISHLFPLVILQLIWSYIAIAINCQIIQ